MMKYLALVVFLAAVGGGGGVQGQSYEDLCKDSGVEFAPHQDCTKYYICDNGNPVEMECGDELYWNPDLNQCDFQNNVPECVDGTRPPLGTTTAAPPTTTQPPTSTVPTTAPTTTVDTTTQPITTVTTQQPTTSTAPPTTTVVTTTTRLPPGQCPPTGIAKIAHETLCNAYYTCVDGVRYEPYQLCPGDLYFDPEIGECNIQSEVDCTPATVVTTEPTTSTTSQRPGLPDCPPTGVHQLPYPGNCTLYVLCVEQVPIIYRCPSGQLFDTEERDCLPESVAVCTVGGFFLVGGGGGVLEFDDGDLESGDFDKEEIFKNVVFEKLFKSRV